MLECFDMNPREIIDLLSAALTSVTAVMVVWIAYRQWKTDELRRRHETYEQRLRVYEAVQLYLVHIEQDAKVDLPQIVQMCAEASECTFLFGEEVQDYIDLLRQKGLKLRSLHSQLYAPDGSSNLPDGEERNRGVEEEKKLLDWFIGQRDESRRLFRRHMGIS